MNLLSLLFSFNGRIGRGQYWLGGIGAGIGAGIIFGLAVALLGSVAKGKEEALGALILLPTLLLVLIVVLIWISLAIQVKRFHDRGQSGWLSLLPALPILGMMPTVLRFAEGTDGNPLAMLLLMAMVFATPAILPYVLALTAINLFFFINLGCLPGTDGPNKYDGGPTNAPPRPNKAPAAPAASSLLSAEQAMERAIAQQALRPATANASPLRPSAPMRATAPPASPLRPATPGGTPSFGRKTR